MSNKKSIGKRLAALAVMSGGFCVGLRYIIKRYRRKDQNSYMKNGKEKQNRRRQKPCVNRGFYPLIVKPALDRLFSLLGLILLTPLFCILAAAIYFDDPGPVFFTQKRIGKNKCLFALHKFRSMKMDAPHDVPTHQLSHPEQYITGIGKILRKTSLDELPQIWDIFAGNMSIIGPRPALWNQEDLIAERDKYGANDIRPGLTGWAQINGRDELEVEEKARLDGEYAECLQKGGWTAFAKDMQCFFRTIDSVLKHDGVREGGTGEKKAADALNSSVDDLYRAANPPLRKDAAIDNIPIKVLIVGEGSYIGTKVEEYLNSFEKRYEVRTLRTRNLVPSPFMFENYDSIFFVAGIAHRRETKKNRDLYYQVNYDLAVNVAQEAKRAKVPHFIILSSIAVYGMETGYISKNTKTAPKNHYGKSKRMADNAIWKLRDDCFRVAILRPPMVYGKGCKGNYQLLRKAAVRLFLFPEMKNRRSMIYIENLCEFVKETIDNKKEGIFFPQNKDYINTSDMVKLIALSNGKKVRSIRFLNPLIKKWPLRILKKVFGDLTCDSMERMETVEFTDSIVMTENSVC